MYFIGIMGQAISDYNIRLILQFVSRFGQALVKLAYCSKVFRLEVILTTAPATSKNQARFNSRQKPSKATHK